MRHRLWDDFDPAELDSEIDEWESLGAPFIILIAEAENGTLAGFAEVGLRSVAEGCPGGTAAYLEGIWVEPEFRRSGVARSLLRAAEDWARAQGLTHFGSDALLDNAASHAWHRAVGFEQVERLVAFAKPIARSEP